MALAENKFYTSPGGTLIVSVLANIPAGTENVALDAPIRYVRHRTLTTTVTEFRQNPPTLQPSDRPVTLEVPLLSGAQLTALRGIYAGSSGIPVTWTSNLYPAGIPVAIVELLSKAHAGAFRFLAKVTLQPL